MLASATLTLTWVDALVVALICIGVVLLLRLLP